MHYHLEIIMPPTENVEKAVGEVMAPFDENGDESMHPFWDFWVIGGRWSGAKLEATLGEERLEEFYTRLKEEKVTVSVVTCGKKTLDPVSQIEKVDAMWREHFPDSGLDACPIFSHSNDQYDSKSILPGDVYALSETPKSMKVNHVIVAGLDYDHSAFEAKYMVQDSMWNGVTFVDTAWDGTIESAIVQHCDHIKNAVDEYKVKNTPNDDWMCVTVDYHS